MTGDYMTDNFSIGGTSVTNAVYWGTGVGNTVTLQLQQDDMMMKSDGKDEPAVTRGKTEISAKLYFSYVKSKMGKIEKEKFKKQAQKLQALLKQAQEINQVAMAETLAKKLQVVVCEMEMQAFGINQWVEEDAINKFRYQVKDRTIDFVKLENFPRTIPAKPRNLVAKIKKAGLFDEFWILFNNPKQDKLETIQQRKAREKDPIVFGKLKAQPKRLYYIADWVDDYCDITLDQFVGELKKVDAQYLPTQLPEIDESYIKKVIKEVRDKEAERGRDRDMKWSPHDKKPGFWKRVWGKIGGEKIHKRVR